MPPVSMQQLSDLPDANQDSAVATAISVNFKLFKYGKVKQTYNRCTAFPTDFFDVFPVCASCLAIHGVDRRVPIKPIKRLGYNSDCVDMDTQRQPGVPCWSSSSSATLRATAPVSRT